MTRNILFILFGIVPASILSLLAIVIAALGIGMIGNGSSDGWSLLIGGVFYVLGTAALFATVLFRMSLFTKIGLVLGCIAAIWALAGDITQAESRSVALQFMIFGPLAISLYVLGEYGIFGSWIRGKSSPTEN